MERVHKCVLVEKPFDRVGFITAIAIQIKNDGIKKRGRTSKSQNNNVRHK